MVECGICFAEYQEGEWELHRQRCVLLLIFRCTLCNVDFVNKEGLWNHLELHEITDESKELHFQELKAKHKLHLCVLCNDQRAYSESLYWNHVHEVHDGGEMQNNDHEFNYCGVGDQTVASEWTDLEIGPIKIENMTSDQDEEVFNDQDSSLQSSANSEKQSTAENHITKGRRRSARIKIANLETVSADSGDSMIEESSPHKKWKRSKSTDTKCLKCDKEYATPSLLRAHIRICHWPVECTICRITLNGTESARYHRIYNHTEPQFECAYCQKKFYFLRRYKQHLVGCGPDKSSDTAENLANEGKDNGNILGRKYTAVEENEVANPSRETECSHCGIKESNAVAMVRHILTHHDPIACDICGANSSNLLQAEDHKKKVHKKRKTKCPHCMTYGWGGQNFLKHVRICENLKEPCDLCGKMLKNPYSVNYHKVHSCHVQKDSKNGQENTATRSKENIDVPDETDSSNVVEKMSLPLTGLSQTKCYYCGENFPAPGYLIHHLKTYHEITKCKICGVTILGMSPRRLHRVVQHTTPRFVCPICGRPFHVKVKYNLHWPNCEQRKHECEICGRKFKKLYSIRQHKRLDHPEDFTLEESTISLQGHPGQSTVNVSTNVHGTASMETANVQKEVLSSRQSLTEDGNLNPFKKIKFSEDSGPSESNESSGNGNDYTDAEKESSMHSSLEQFKCSICDEKFFEFSDIRQHMLTNHTDGMLRCQFCSKKIRRVQELEAHQIVCAERKFSCKLCPHKFKLGSSIKKHMNKFHPNSLPLGTEEQQSNSVKEIEATRSSNKKCPYCEKTFSNLRLRARHIFVSHEPTACDICGLTFANATRARYHKINIHLKHPMFKCPHCLVQYRKEERFKQHLSVCKGFPCDVCGKKYADQRCLIKHKEMYHYDKEEPTKGQLETQNPTKNDGHEKNVTNEATNSSIAVSSNCPICKENFG